MRKNLFISSILLAFVLVSAFSEIEDVEYEENYEFNEFEFEEQEKISEENFVDYQQNPVLDNEEFDEDADDNVLSDNSFEKTENTLNESEKEVLSSSDENSEENITLQDENVAPEELLMTDVLNRTDEIDDDNELSDNSFEKTENTLNESEKEVLSSSDENSEENITLQDENVAPEELLMTDVLNRTDEIEDDNDEYDDDELDENGNKKRKWHNYLKKVNLLRKPKRIFEIGFQVDTGVSNNFLNAKDFFVEEVVIDLPQMSEDVPSDGWQIDFLFNNNLYVNLNLINNMQFGVNFGVDAYGFVNVSKKLFDYLGKGFNYYETLHVGGNAEGESFFYTQAKIGFDLFGFHITAKPALVKPLLKLETNDMYGAYKNDSDGSVIVSAIADMTVYGGTNLEPIFEGDSKNISIGEDIFKNCGFDFEICVEHSFFSTLQCGAYLRVPMVPGKFGYKSDILMSFDYQVDGLKYLINQEGEDPDVKDIEKTYGSASLNVHRPFKTGIEVAWRPLGNWFSLGALAGLGIRQPYTSDAKYFAEYNLSCEATMLNMLGGWFSTGYFNEIFKHEAGIIMNFRFVELDLGVSLQGSDFKSSFKGAGIGAFVNFAVGF